jgi:methylmalonyl-CoA/ethylmalonyl-CoA epimerase
MRKIEHIGIAVKNLYESDALFSAVLNVKPYKKEEVQSEGVLTSFFQVGESKIELLQGTNPQSTISKFIEKKGEGIHHIAFDVANIEEEITRLKAQGLEFVNDTPKKGADNKLICFLHPKKTNGVLIELCQELK